MTHNLIYDHKGKMIANSGGNLIALPPARHWLELQKEKISERDIMSVVQEGESVTFEASYPSQIATIGFDEDPNPSYYLSVYFGIESKYTLVSDPNHGLEIQATIYHSPDIIDHDVNNGYGGRASINNRIYLSSEAGRGGATTEYPGFVTIPENPEYSEFSNFYMLLTPDTIGLDYRSHVRITIVGHCRCSTRIARNSYGTAYGYTYNRPAMTYTLTIRKVKLYDIDNPLHG